MTETGQPLIPREILPAPVKAAKNPPVTRPAPVPDEAGRQLSFFGAETTDPSPADLAGLLAAGGVLGRMGGTARVSVQVDAAWRVHVLVAELVSRGLVVTWAPFSGVRRELSPLAPEVARPSADRVTEAAPVPSPKGPSATFDPDADPPPDLPSDLDFPPDDPEAGTVSPVDETPAPVDESVVNPDSDTPPDSETEAEVEAEDQGPPKPVFEVRTAYSSRLNGLARAWPAAAAQLFLSGPRLRLWVAAAGEPVDGGYALGLDPAQDPAKIDAALVRAGLAERVSEDGRRYVITGRRRLKWLAELVGDRPGSAPEHLWPDGAAA